MLPSYRLIALVPDFEFVMNSSQTIRPLCEGGDNYLPLAVEMIGYP